MLSPLESSVVLKAGENEIGVKYLLVTMLHLQDYSSTILIQLKKASF